MASSRSTILRLPCAHASTNALKVKIPKPKGNEESDDLTTPQAAAGMELPQTLVRIPTEDAPKLLKQTEANEE